MAWAIENFGIKTINIIRAKMFFFIIAFYPLKGICYYSGSNLFICHLVEER
jgi:hypothetical protein